MRKTVTLGDVIEINPTLAREVRQRPHNTEVPFLPMAAVSEDGTVSYSEVRNLGALLKGYTSFSRGDVLLAKITPCFENGKAAHLDDLPADVGFGSTEFHVLRPGPEMDGRYLFHLVHSPKFREVGERHMVGTAGQKRVPADFLRSFRTILPPLPEQHRIAALLDRADALRRKREESRRLVGELLRSVFLEMFGDPVRNEKGWEVVPLGEVVDRIEAGTSMGGEERPANPGEWSVLKVSAVTSRTYRPDEAKVVSRSPQSPVIPEPGDLLFSRANTRELVAATCIVDQHRSRTFLPDKIWRVSPNDSRLQSTYLHFLLGVDGIRRRLTRQATGTSGSMYNVSQAKFLALCIPLPPTLEQARFSAVVAAANGLAERIHSAGHETGSLAATLSARPLSAD